MVYFLEMMIRAEQAALAECEAIHAEAGDTIAKATNCPLRMEVQGRIYAYQVALRAMRGGEGVFSARFEAAAAAN